MNLKLLLLIAFLSSSQNSQLSSVVGAVSEFDQNARTITIKTDQNAMLVIRTSDETVYLRVPPGAQSLEQATAIKLAEIAVGDQLRALGEQSKRRIACAVQFLKKGSRKGAEAQRKLKA